MKRFLAIFLLFGALSANGVQALAASALKFDSPTHDFGAIREQDGIVEHVFRFTNESKSPVVIERVESSCGCTTPSYSREPIMPGKQGSISVAFDPANRPGIFAKEITVVSGNGTNYDRLTIKGEVAPRPRTIADDYPVELTDGIRLTGYYINFYNIGQGETRSMTIGYVNTSARSVLLAVAAAKHSPELKFTSPGMVCAGCRGEITVTYDLTGGQAWGARKDELIVLVNNKPMPAPITISASLVDNFSRTADPAGEPRAKLSPMFHHFGDVKSDRPLVHTFTIENTGGGELVVRHVGSSEGVTTSLRAGDKAAAGKSLSFTVEMNPAAVSGNRVTGTVTITLNDRVRPMREIRLVANLQK